MSRSDIPIGGLEERTRELLTRLHRGVAGPFSIDDAAPVLGLPTARVRKLLAYLASRGWLARVRRGLYTTVPLDASDPRGWLADPWCVAMTTFAPGYVGGWTALHHWGLTEQLVRSVVVCTAAPIRSKEKTIQGTVFRLRQVPADNVFGTKTVWRQKSPVQLSDPERTLVDVLERPDLGGGIRHVADCIEEWLKGDERPPAQERLLDYAERVGNRTVYKRLGFVLEARELTEPDLLEACTARMSRGLSALDPSSSAKGRVLKRWWLRVNARI